MSKFKIRIDGEDYTAELFDEGQDARRLELENEKAALLARLEEINRLLNKE